MTYPKPLSANSLKKMYAEADISDQKSSFLHRFFLAGARLYGVVTVSDLWEIYKCYKDEAISLHRKDFTAFSSIARREELPYFVFEIDEVYSEEERRDTERMIISRNIVGRGYGRYYFVYRLDEAQEDKPFYIPEHLEDYLAFSRDDYMIPQEKKLRNYLDHLKVTAHTVKVNGKNVPCQHYGQYLKDFEFMSFVDKGVYEVLCRDKSHAGVKSAQAFLDQCSIPESERLFNNIQFSLMTGSSQLTELLKEVTDELNEVGVTFSSEKEVQNLLNLIMDYNNNAHLWSNRGWSPVELAEEMHEEGHSGPIALKLGPGVMESIRRGDVKLEDIRKMAAERGMQVIVPDKW